MLQMEFQTLCTGEKKCSHVYCEYIFLFRAEKLYIEFLNRVLTLFGPKMLVKRDKNEDENSKRNK